MSEENKGYFITVRVDEEMYVELSRLASETMGGNMSKMLRKVYRRFIDYAQGS